jgi:hypothetical protein
VWCAERLYPDLYAQVSHPLFEYSFYDMPKEGITSDGFISVMDAVSSFSIAGT